MGQFKLESQFKPAGDQPMAISMLLDGLKKDDSYQTLLGVTGSGKTFTIANVIEHVQKPTLVIAHNKTLAAQLAQEYRSFFPKNAVHYFVSYYDYYQPEAYLPITDTYIEKDAMINKEIDRLRHASTQALLTRRDVIIVASVSCIYGLGSKEEYAKQFLRLSVGDRLMRNELLHTLVSLFYTRTNADLSAGLFRAIGKTVEIMPMGESVIYCILFAEDAISEILQLNPITRQIEKYENFITLYPAKHFLTPEESRIRALRSIEDELAARLAELKKQKKILEVERLKRRTRYDLAMIREIGTCAGIENYSRHLSNRNEGEPPDTLLSYFPSDFLTIIDESHVTLPQIEGMYAGDRSRKKTLVEHGFRLPSALDNRPLTFKEFSQKVGQIICTSATPGANELKRSDQVVEQIIRPTGLLDPAISVRPIKGHRNATRKDIYPGQVEDCIKEIDATVTKGDRALVTTLTKKMAEDLSEYLKERVVKAEYIHSEVKTLDRIRILTDFRKGKFDVLVGVNLLREGLDLPEVSFIGILDADKEGFLRSATSLIQTIGRAARNSAGRVILYADHVTGSMQRAIEETERRRKLQSAYNRKHGITPMTIKKNIADITDSIENLHTKTIQISINIEKSTGKSTEEIITNLRLQMVDAVKILDFETAALLRDEIRTIERG